MTRSGTEIRVLILGPTKPVGGMENCVKLHASLNLGDGFRTYHIDNRYHPIIRKAKVLKVFYLYLYLLPKMRSIIRKEKIDIVHIHSTSFKNVFKNIEIQTLIKKWGAKSILHIHGGYFDRFYAGLKSFLKKRVEWGLNRSDALICLSEGWRKFYTSNFKQARVYVLENVINVNEFAEMADYRNYSVKDIFTLLFLGRISEMKGVFDLVEVARKLRADNQPVKFVLAGRSEKGEDAKLRWLLKDQKLDGWFELAGEVTGKKRERLFREADCFILPSHAEGMPITILEAFAAGLPVIATNVGAVSEIIRNGENGIVVEAKDIDALTASVAKMRNGNAFRESAGRLGLEEVREFHSTERWVSELRRIYSEVAG